MVASARLTTLTRVGFAARGLLYLVIAYLVLTAGRSEDPSGALRYLGEGGSKWLLVLMTVGFVAYGLWRLTDAAFNIEQHEDGPKGLRQRLGAGGSGVVHLLLAWQAIGLLQGSGGGGGGGSFADGNRTLLAIAGLVLLGVGAFQLVKAANASFCKKLDGRVANHPWVKTAGRLGYAARGLVFLISGYFFVRAGLGDGGQGGGMDEALSWLESPWDVLVAIGLALFGIFSLIEARYRRIHDVPVEGMAREFRNKMGA
jgi:hypothetical protein